ncbi:MAG: hypothetical protein ACRDQ0_03335 [Pseudonocardia sp.]
MLAQGLPAPTSEEAARLVLAAFDQDDEWGTLVWLTMATGTRRSELAALRCFVGART